MSWNSPQGPRGWAPPYGYGGSPNWGGGPPQGFRPPGFGASPRQVRPPAYSGWGNYNDASGYGPGQYAQQGQMGPRFNYPHPNQQNQTAEEPEIPGEEPPAPGEESSSQPQPLMSHPIAGPPLPQPPLPPQNNAPWGAPGGGLQYSGFNPFPSQLLGQQHQQQQQGGKKKKKKKNKGANNPGGIAPYGFGQPPPPPPPPLPPLPETIPTPPGPPPPPKPQESSESKSTSGPSDNPSTWPLSLQAYVSRCYNKAKTEMDKDQVEIILKGKITKAQADGSLWEKDWDNEPLPSTLSVDFKGPSAASTSMRGGLGQIKFGIGGNKNFGQRNVQNPFRSRSPARSSSNNRRQQRRRRDSSDSSSSSGSRQSTSSSTRRPRSPDYGGNVNRIPLGTKGKPSPRGKIGFGRGAGTSSGGDILYKAPGLQKRKMLRTAKNRREDVDDDDEDAADDDGNVPYFYTNGSKRMTLDADLASTERRQKRAARFAGSAAGSSGGGQVPRKKSLNLLASINTTLMTGDNFEESCMQWENLHIIGTCQDLEKRFLRLTSAPESHMVRPVSVLKRSLSMVVEKWKQKQDYHYTCDQLKSIRQDLTVQGIRDEFTIQVYETHARVALEKVDTTEFNQCQSQLRMLYHDIGGKNRLEFTAYRILYYMYTRETLDLTSVMNELNDVEKKDECISHALKLRTAWSLQNYRRFFCLYKNAPKMSGYIIDWFIERERKAALRIIIKSYRPSIPIEFVRRQLAYDESDEDWAKFVEPFGLQFTDRTKTLLDCKNSMACLAAIA